MYKNFNAPVFTFRRSGYFFNQRILITHTKGLNYIFIKMKHIHQKIFNGACSLLLYNLIEIMGACLMGMYKYFDTNIIILPDGSAEF